MRTLRTAGPALLLAVCLQTEPLRAANSDQNDVGKAVEAYCTSISDLAAERRVARQASALKELEAKVSERLDLLDERTKELAELIRKRNELRDLANKELVDIYAGVEAEAAAAQMEKLDFRLASSVLRKLKPRQASAILDVMKPELAAQLIRTIAATGQFEKVQK